MFELRAVTHEFAGTAAVAQLDLTVERGQTVALIGPSGCGKSTVLRLMLGLLTPTTGAVLFDGAPLSQDNMLAQRQRMGYVIQGGGLFPHLTADGNVALLAEHLGWDAERIQARRTELGTIASIAPDIWSRYPAQISGGQAQRVALVRALMIDPEVLLLDEPLGALDPLVRTDLQQELREIIQGLGKTVVLVTHDMREAAYFADRIVLMKDGRMVQTGTFADLNERPVEPFVTRFLRAQEGPVLA
ncbi:MAG: osmoprotectant transport system ATP-binding protein [Planctomycetota bacterium]|jgi:osmoprotectant transport system ATP-binding protein